MRSFKFQNIIPLLLTIIFSSFLVIDILLNQGIFTAHDIETNLIYFGSFYSSIIEGNFIPRWAGNVANLYGSPINMFFYPFSYYQAVIIKLLGFSLIDTMKIYIFVSFILSSVFMYLWLKNHLSRNAAFIGAFLYVYAPYRINDIFARGSVAENTAFMLIPLVLYFLYWWWQKVDLRRSIILAVVSAALILSHPFMVVIFLPFYIFYIFFLGLDYKKIKYLFLVGIICFLLTSFYILPLIIENKYTHYDISPFNGSHYEEQFISFKQLILPIWTFIDRKGKLEYQTYQIGILQIILFLSGLFAYWFYRKKGKSDRKINHFYTLGLLNFILSIFLMLPSSNFIYKTVPFLQRIEFPWRYLSLNLFSLTIMFSASYMSISNIRIKQIILIIIVVGGLMLYLPHAKGHGYKLVKDQYYLFKIRENTDGFATLPRWASQPELYPRIIKRYVLLEGMADINSFKRTNIKHIYNVDAYTPIKFMDATFYFPGWEVYIDGLKTEIEFQNPDYRGIITFNVPKGKHLIEVLFRSTKVRKFADLITILTIAVIILGFIYAKTIENHINRYTHI